MATEEVVVVVSERGAKQTANAIGAIGTQAKQSNEALDKLKNLIQLVGGAVVVERLKTASDAYLGINNRLKLVTKSSEDLAATQEKLLGIANGTRSSFEGTAALYTKLSLSAKELNVSQEEIAKVVERTNKAIVLSGATTQEATGGLIQFSQGLASGRLQGEELRSVLENLPALALQIAKGLNTTVGQLRKLGADGALTTSAVIGALRKQGKEIDDAFSKFTPTISQSLTVLNNQFIDFIGKAGQTSGAVKLISDSILLLANNLGTVANTLVTAGVAFGALKLAAFTQSLYGAIVAGTLFNAVLRLNPIIAFATALVTITTALVTFGQNIQIGTEKTQTLAAVTGTALGILKETFMAVLGLGVKLAVYLGTNLYDAIMFIVKAFAFAGTKIKEWYDKGMELVGTIADFIKTKFEDAISFVTGLWDDFLNKVRDVGRAIGDVVSRVTGGSKSAGGASGPAVGRLTDDTSSGDTFSGGGGSGTLSGGEGDDTLSTGTLQKALTSQKTEGTFTEAVRSGSGPGFQSLTGSQERLSQNISTANQGIRAGISGVGNKIGGYSKDTVGQLRMNEDAQDETTVEVRRVTGAIDSLSAQLSRSDGMSGGSIGRSTGGGGGVSGGDVAQTIAGTRGGATASGSFTITKTPPYEQWIKNIGGSRGDISSRVHNLLLQQQTTQGKQAFDMFSKEIGNTVRRYDAARAAKELGSAYDTLVKFRNGGSMMVNGTGAVDSTVVAMRATKGERIDVMTAKQQREKDRMNAQASKVVQLNVNITTPDADSFRKSKTQILGAFVQDLQRSLQNV